MRAVTVLLSLWCCSALAEDLRGALVDDARHGFILSYARARHADGARANLEPLCWGNRELLRRSMAQLADAFEEIGKFHDAAAIWRELSNEAPSAADSALFQARTLSVVRVDGRRGATVDQALAMAKTLRAALTAHPGDARLDEAMDLAERELSALAITWHRERPDFDTERANRATDAIYQTYLELFPSGDKSYQLRFFRAELAFNELRDYRLAAQLYTDVLMEDVARTQGDPAAKPGKFMELAGYDAILAYDALAKGI